MQFFANKFDQKYTEICATKIQRQKFSINYSKIYSNIIRDIYKLQNYSIFI